MVKTNTEQVLRVFEVGAFAYDLETGVFTGPATYMAERGNEKLNGIIAGTDVAFNVMMRVVPPGTSAIHTVLVAMQTDYAGWKGVRELTKAMQVTSLPH